MLSRTKTRRNGSTLCLFALTKVYFGSGVSVLLKVSVRKCTPSRKPFRPPNRLIAESKCSVGRTNVMLRSGGVIFI